MADDHEPQLNRELIQQLCLEAGWIMENTSADMALVLPVDVNGIVERVDQLQRAADKIFALAHAAHALVC